MNIFYKPHVKRNKEREFFQTLVSHFPHATHCKADYLIGAEYLNQYVDRDQVITFVEQIQSIPNMKRDVLIETLANCPKNIKVAPYVQRIGFDIVLELNNAPYFFEFHEKQHRSLSVNRLQKIYSPKNIEYLVPRFVQRFVRDIWRMLYFRPYTIVWFDWFADNKSDYTPELHSGFVEHCMTGKFAFMDFYNLVSPSD